MDKILKVTIHNIIPDHYRFVIARLCNGELWYFATWSTREKAERMIEELGFENAIIIDTEAEE